MVALADQISRAQGMAYGRTLKRKPIVEDTDASRFLVLSARSAAMASPAVVDGPPGVQELAQQPRQLRLRQASRLREQQLRRAVVSGPEADLVQAHEHRLDERVRLPPWPRLESTGSLPAGKAPTGSRV